MPRRKPLGKYRYHIRNIIRTSPLEGETKRVKKHDQEENKQGQQNMMINLDKNVS